MTRTNRYHSRTEEAGLPKYFAKSGFVNTDPRKVKKDGHGRGNWGREGDEIEDLEQSGEFTFHHTRRRSNSMSATHPDMMPQNKFEMDEDVFEEE